MQEMVKNTCEEEKYVLGNQILPGCAYLAITFHQLISLLYTLLHFQPDKA